MFTPIHVESQCALVLCGVFLLQTVWPHVVYKAVHEHDSLCGMLFDGGIYNFGGVFDVSCIGCNSNAADVHIKHCVYESTNNVMCVVRHVQVLKRTGGSRTKNHTKQSSCVA